MQTKKKIGSTEWIDPDDAPEFTKEMFESAQWEINGVPIPTPPSKGGRPRKADAKQLVSLRLAPDVLAYYKADGAGWNVRMEAALRSAMKPAKADG
jgi:uncharacterized protein (DUF4415 family)